MIDRRTVLTGALALIAAPAGAEERVLRMRDLYEKDLSFTPLAQEIAGSRVTTKGFMAPPLKAMSDFFVLTKRPMAVCPFCETEAEWPDDILAVYTKRTVRPVPFNVMIQSRGILRIGTRRDGDTGFLSRVWLEDATYDRV